MVPEYCTFVAGNSKRAVALKFSFHDTLIIGGIVVSLPFIRSKTVLTGITLGIARLFTVVKVIDTAA